MNTLVEKPPIYGESPSRNLPQTKSGRKVKRSNPVRRQNTHGTSRQKKGENQGLTDKWCGEDEEKLQDGVLEERSAEEEEETEESLSTSSEIPSCLQTHNTAINHKALRPNSLDIMDSTTNLPQPQSLIDEKRASYLAKRRNTEGIEPFRNAEACTCRTHRGGLGSCSYCKKSKRRHTMSPLALKQEVMEHEAKLLVLEYLSSLPANKLTARLKSSPQVEYEFQSKATVTPSKADIPEAQDENDGGTKNSRQNSKKGNKANTVTIGQHEREELMRQLREHDKQYKENGKLNRSASDVSECSYSHMKKKLEKMKLPVQRWLQINHEIATFDKNTLNQNSCGQRKLSPRIQKQQNIHEATTSKKPALSLTMPRRSIQQLARAESPMFTPETFAVNRLEEISQDIMDHYPELLHDAIDAMLSPLNNSEQSLTYDIFSRIARTVYNIKVRRVSATVWSRVALVLYLVKETMILGNLNDTQLELLVEHSTKFMTENVTETVQKEGGWEALELDDWMFYSNVLARDEYYSTDEETNKKKNVAKKISRQDRKECSFREQVTETLYEWTPYGMAALAVGLGLAYSYLKI